jgi:hypothetical protein
MPEPPKICTASRAQYSNVLEPCTLSKAHCAPKAESGTPILNAYAICSTNAWRASIWRAISASLKRMIWCSMSRLPNVRRVVASRMDSE